MNVDYRTKYGKEVLRIRREAVEAYKRLNPTRVAVVVVVDRTVSR